MHRDDAPTPLSRREFVGAAAVSALAGAGAASAQRGAAQATPSEIKIAPPAAGVGPVVIASANGLRTVARAREMIVGGADPLDAIVDGVSIVENDPEDMSVGLGGLPDEEGVVTLDASVMHGPRHRAGAVAAIRNIKNPAAVAREVARRTDHVLLVGDGALKFAKRCGFEEENLLTDKSRKAWLKWRSRLSRLDAWLQEDEYDIPTPPEPPEEEEAFLRELREEDPHLAESMGDVLHTWGTIHCSALTASGDLAGCTTTSGLSWKLPGRVGDSPIIGAGCYTDNDVGSAGATGRGEACIQIGGARYIVMRMSLGDTPQDACMAALKMVVAKTTAQRLMNRRAQPSFNLTFYAVRKDGLYGGATLRERRRDAGPKSKVAKFAVADAKGARLEECAFLFEAEQ